MGVRRLGIVAVVILGSLRLVGCIGYPPSNECEEFVAYCPVPDGGDGGDGSLRDSGPATEAAQDAMGMADANDAETGSLMDVTSEPDASTPDASGDAAPTDASDAHHCDTSLSPIQDLCVVSDDLGVFVSPHGSDGNPGSRSAPVATIGHGMDVAVAAGKRVYVCSGQYAEKLVVDATRDGVAVYGGLDCATGTYTGMTKATVAPTAAGYALELAGLVKGAVFEDMGFVPQNADRTHPGESSVAVFAHGSSNVVFRRSSMVAGTGAPGANGADAGTTPVSSNWYVGELAGASDADGGGAPAKVCTCADGVTTSTGGRGGVAGIAPGSGLPFYPNDAGAGEAGINNSRSGYGTDGLNAPAPDPAPPSATLGSLTAAGWAAAAGSGGPRGNPGQGGGGGGDGPGMAGSGGGGACGGCGGAGGPGGGAGGSSFAVLSFDSSLSFSTCTFTANLAGAGGAGGAGEAGQAGGFPGAEIPPGRQGGGGGAGSGGGGGQGGPGGLSIGIGYVGVPPTIDAASVLQAATLPGITVPAMGGAGGGAGPAGAAAVSATGIGQPAAGPTGIGGRNGVSQAVLAL